MPYETLMVHLDLARSNAEVLRVASVLAAAMQARLVGIAACQPMQWAYGDGYNGGTPIVDCQDELTAELRAAEAEFRAASKGGEAKIEWRSAFTTEPLPYYLASEARCADLLISCVPSASLLDSARRTSLGDLVMRAGKPVLVVPHAGAIVPFERITLAWKDSREARRAATDALPLLARARTVSILEVAGKADLPFAQGRVEDVAGWLARHGITALPLAVPSQGDDAHTLAAFLDEHNSDLVVAGAYGHTRLREWAFGGVTRELLSGGRCALLSH
jgi:nucleotide-binding universal stress UspA family protein